MKKKAAAKLNEQIDVQLTKLELSSGDVVVMKFHFPLEPEIVKGLTAKLYDALPRGVRVLVVDPTIDIEIHHISEVAIARAASVGTGEDEPSRPL